MSDWEMTPTELRAIYEAHGTRLDMLSNVVAHEAAVKARAETAKEIGEWLITWRKDFREMDNDWRKLGEFVAALKEGKP